MNEVGYIIFAVLLVLSNIYAYKVGSTRKSKEVDSLRKHANEAMKLVFKKQREINELKGLFKYEEPAMVNKEE